MWATASHGEEDFMSPVLNFEYAAGTAVQHLSQAAAARDLSISPTVLTKALTMGLLPDLSYQTIAAAAALPVITDLRDDTGNRVPVLRLGPLTQDITQDPDEESRSCYGYDIDMSATDLEGSALRYWRAQYVQEVVDLGALIVVAASFIVAVAHVHEALPVGDKWAFQGHLVAHTNGPVTTTKIVADDPTSPLIKQAHQLLGNRLLGGGGGSITLA